MLALEHHRRQLPDEEVSNPERQGGQGHRLSPDGAGEYFADDNPADGAEGEGEAGDKQQYKDEDPGALYIFRPEQDADDEQGEDRTGDTGEEQGSSPPFIYSENSKYRITCFGDTLLCK